MRLFIWTILLLVYFVALLAIGLDMFAECVKAHDVFSCALNRTLL